MSAMARRLTSLLIALLLAAALAPAGALADGDPASDVLLGQNVFYPYSPAVPGAVQAKLNAETAAAKRAGLPIKVALIGSPIDLGVIPELFGKPQSYADFLDKEISFQQVQPLLVVMAAGYGVQGLRPPQPTPPGRCRSPPAGPRPTSPTPPSPRSPSWPARPGIRSAGSPAAPAGGATPRRRS